MKCITGFFILLTSFLPLFLNAQVIENSINFYGNDYPAEKIHIHFDKESYLPGETIWFKAYLFEENLPSEKSTNFYAALYDEDGKMLQQLISPVFYSCAEGHFDLPDTIESSKLVCRAYTTWMLNFDTAFIYYKTIKIMHRASPENKIPSVNTVSLRFFPEGGEIIEGTVNSIAFKINDNNGLPFYTEGTIRKQGKDEMIMPLVVQHNGMGKFNLLTETGEKYYAEWIDNAGNRQQTWLPEAKARGVSLKVAVQKDKIYFNLVNKTGNDSLHVLMYMYQKVFYKTGLKVGSTKPFTGVVPVSDLPTGTMQLTVFDAGWNPVAERIAFINNNNYSVNAGLFFKTINVQKRGKNEIEILVADSIPANMSLSITDAALNSDGIEHTIASDFLLKGDVKGYIHDPAYYFTNNTDSTKQLQLDLVMLTNGWRRYNWADMLVQKTPAIYFPADAYLSIYGQISKEAMNNKGADELVNLIIRTTDNANLFYMVPSEENGIIKHKGMVFFDTVLVFYSFNKNKSLNAHMAFSNRNFTHEQPAVVKQDDSYFFSETKAASFFKEDLFTYYDEKITAAKNKKVITLQTVTVKTAKSPPNRFWSNLGLEAIDEKYAQGYFRGFTKRWRGDNNNIFGIDVFHDHTADLNLDIATYTVRKLNLKWLSLSKDNLGNTYIL